MESPEIPVINKAAEDRLMAAFDGLDADLGRLLADFRKLKRDRRALLDAAKRASSHFTPICDWRKDGAVIGQLDAAIAAAEEE